ncbi:MAG: HipA domain-containing protein [Acidimicrobiales bacterium]
MADNLTAVHYALAGAGRDLTVERHPRVALTPLSVALGNLDLHAKNLSILHRPDGSMSLAPAYDVVPQAHLPNDGEVALVVGGEYCYAAITISHLVCRETSMGTHPGGHLL